MSVMRSKAGFTLAELVIIILVISILAIAAFPTMDAIDTANMQKYDANCRSMFDKTQADLDKFNRGWQVKPQTEWLTDGITKKKFEYLTSSSSGIRLKYNLDYFFTHEDSKYRISGVRSVVSESRDESVPEIRISKKTPKKVYYLVVRESYTTDTSYTGATADNLVPTDSCDMNVEFDSRGQPKDKLEILRVIYYDGRKTYTLTYDPLAEDFNNSYVFTVSDVEYSDEEYPLKS